MILRRVPSVWVAALASCAVSGYSLAAEAQPSGGKETSSRPRAAFLNIDRSPVGVLLEQRLLANPRAAWLERTEIDAVLRERQLQSLFGAAAIDERAKIGRLLKADLLVLLASPLKPSSKSVNLVVCETAYGLRLAAMTVPSGKPESDAAMLEGAVDRAIQRHREKITEIAAVPPFVSRDLSYERNHLQGAYAKLVEQELADRPGLLTQVKDFGKKIGDFRPATARKSFGDGAGIAKRRCSEDLLR